MDQDIFLVLDFDKSCRLCLQTRGAMSDIFEICEDTISLTEQIERTTGVIITKNENLPRKICHKCRYIVELSFELRETTVRSDHLLKEPVDHDTIPETVNMKTESAITTDIEHEDETANDPDVSDSIKNESEETEESNSEELTAVKVEKNNNTSLEAEQAPEDDEKTETIKKESKRKKTLERKNKTKSPPRCLTCLICLKVLESRSAVLQHAVSVHYQSTGLTPYMIAKKPFTCNLCSSTNLTRKDLLLHHLSHLDATPFVCEAPNCGFRAKSKQSLRQHSLSHGERTFICEMCGAAYRRKWQLMQHATRHADEGSAFPCRLCRVVCRNRISFKAHLKYHELGHRFKCSEAGCPKAFYSRNDLEVHVRAHNNERVFQCHMCVSSYISRSQLNRHILQHDKQRVRKCDKCSSTFKNYAQFFNHRIVTHGPWQPHKCRGCNQGYQSISRLEKHIARCGLAQNILENERNKDDSGNNDTIYNSNDDFNLNIGCSSSNNCNTMNSFIDSNHGNNNFGNSSYGVIDQNDGIGNSINGNYIVGNSNVVNENSVNGIGDSNYGKNNFGNSGYSMSDQNNGIANLNNGNGNLGTSNVGISINGIGCSNHENNNFGNSNIDIGNSSYYMSNQNNSMGRSNHDNNHFGNSSYGVGDQNNGNNNLGNLSDSISSLNNGIVNSNDEIVSLEMEEFLGQKLRRTVAGPVLVKPYTLNNGKINTQDSQLAADSLLYIEVDNEEDVDDPDAQCYIFVPK